MTTEMVDDYAYHMPFRMIADRMTQHGVMLSSGTRHRCT